MSNFDTHVGCWRYHFNVFLGWQCVLLYLPSFSCLTVISGSLDRPHLRAWCFSLSCCASTCRHQTSIHWCFLFSDVSHSQNINRPWIEVMVKEINRHWWNFWHDCTLLAWNLSLFVVICISHSISIVSYTLSQWTGWVVGDREWRQEYHHQLSGPIWICDTAKWQGH